MGLFETKTVWETIDSVECCSCSIIFGMPRNFIAQRREDKESFFCPNGHEQHYLGKTRAQQLEAELKEKEAELARTRADLGRRLADESQRANTATVHLASAKRRARKARAVARKLKQRARGGLCPCCKRSFTTLARHMKSKHPTFAR